MSEWISVDDSLPEIGKPVLVFLDLSEQRVFIASIVYFIDDIPIWEVQYYMGILPEADSPTYWMPLPKPPKED